jgi:hypothetical protein
MTARQKRVRKKKECTWTTHFQDFNFGQIMIDHAVQNGSPKSQHNNVDKYWPTANAFITQSKWLWSFSRGDE